MANIILHQIGNTAVGMNSGDGYINATAMVAGHKERTGQRKDIADWLRLKRTQETLEHLSLITGIPVIKLYQVFQGSPDAGGGTWIQNAWRLAYSGYRLPETTTLVIKS
jgi:hypothetical protein